MRVKLSLAQLSQKTVLPINYNYHLTSLIYEILSRSSTNYSEFLHEKGYLYEESKKFKLFTYSQLRFRDMNVQGDKIISTSKEINLFISSPIDEFVEHLANGLMAKGRVDIDGSPFRTKTVEIMELPEFQEKERVKFVCLSPIVSSTMKEKDGDLKTYYYRHDDPELMGNLKENLEKKYELVHGHCLDNDRETFDIRFDQDYIERKNGQISKLVNFKGTKIKGIFAPFELTAPPDLMEIGYEAGFGGKGSMGFGMVEVVNN